MPPRTLTQRELNRALLARQLLLERARTSPPQALERIGGIQAQYAPAMYIGLWSRLDGFERDTLTQALERRTVVQATLMRSTIHLVSRPDYWPLMLAIRDARREHWLRTGPREASRAEMEAAAKRLRPRLSGEPMRRGEIEELVGKAVARGIGLWLELVRVPPSGTWHRRRADLFAAAQEWVGRPEVDTDAAVELLVRRYLGGFGPASKREIAAWAGTPIATIALALERLELRRFRAENGDELLDLPRAPLPDPDTPAPVRFLPVYDATLLAHARRTQILPEEHRPKVFNTKTPQSVNTFLVDGAVAGSWRYDEGRVRIQPFGRLPKGARAELEEEGERLAAFHT